MELLTHKSFTSFEALYGQKSEIFEDVSVQSLRLLFLCQYIFKQILLGGAVHWTPASLHCLTEIPCNSFVI